MNPETETHYLHSSNETVKRTMKATDHYDAEVYPNFYGQICPMLVSLVRFYYVNTLKMEQYCGK